MPAKQIVAIYNGRGVSAHSYRRLRQLLADSFETISINPAQINSGELSAELAAIVFPGGADVPYDRALTDAGIKHIRNFVENGGLYVGVCAGSSFAGKAVDFTCADGAKICESRRLKFFQGIVQGPAYGNYIKNSHESAKLVELKIQAKIYQAYFNGGGHFIADASFKDSEILATYADSDLPAALHLNIGNGQVFLCAFHPEYNNDFLHKPVNAKENGSEALLLMLSKGGISENIGNWFVQTISKSLL